MLKEELETLLLLLNNMDNLLRIHTVSFQGLQLLFNTKMVVATQATGVSLKEKRRLEANRRGEPRISPSQPTEKVENLNPELERNPRLKERLISRLICSTRKIDQRVEQSRSQDITARTLMG